MVTAFICPGIYTGYACEPYGKGENYVRKYQSEKYIQNLPTGFNDLAGEVYRVLGSFFGTYLTGRNRDTTIRTLSMLMYTKPDGHLLRSELALISNMARTIKDDAERSRLMTEHDENPEA